MTRHRPIQTADDRLNELPLEALECRERGHSWPRSSSTRMVLKATKYRGDRVTEAEREMTCEGGCGRIRVETFEILPNGRMWRAKPPRYRIEPGKVYLLPKPEDGATHQSRVDRDEVRYALIARLYPDLKW